MAKNKFAIQINTDDLNDSPQKRRPQLDTLGQRQDNHARALATGKSAISGLGSTSNYGRRFGASNNPPIDPRDMWKDPSSLRNQANDAEAKFFEDMRIIATKRRMENDTEYFEAEDDDENMPKINEYKWDEEQGNFEYLARGTELIDDEIDTSKAYQYFRRLEESSRDENIRVLESEVGGLVAPSSQEIPSRRMQRLKRELDDLERELRELEQEEIPTQIKEDQHSAKYQLSQVDSLRNHMHDVLQSTNFQDLETHQPLNFSEIIGKKRQQEGEQANTLGLPRVLAKALAEQVSQLNPTLATELELTDQVELTLRQDGAFDTDAQKTDADLKREAVQKYLQIQASIDKVESLVGQWNPINKFSSVFRIVNNLAEQIDEFNTRQEETSIGAPTPQNASARFIALQTPASGARSGETMSKRAQQFNDELERIENKLATMSDVAYERQKIDFLYSFAERSLEQLPHVDLITERLQVLERIHKESPNIEAQLETIRQNVLVRFPKCLEAEQAQLKAVRQQIIESASTIETLFV